MVDAGPVELEGANAVVTGAAGGIGAAFARVLLERGAHVVLGDLDEERLTATADGLRGEFGDRVRQRVGDSSTDLGVTELLAVAPGPVDLFVANAGVFRGFGLEATDQDWALSWEVNVLAHVAAARALVPGWLASAAAGGAGGAFVSVASAAGLLTQLGSPTYSATKHAALGFAEWLAATYGDQGVQVTAVCPMGVRTAMLEEGETSEQPDARLGMRSVVSAGEPIDAREVAEVALAALASGRFLALPHPEVDRMQQQKAADRDRWITGMQRFRTSLES
ncbi:SDR family oxidoreductase [Aeromicrobium sp. Leaf350]|uniref:SDR family oxidoreductase n=1 Tax=Aeromicrobium sp. Leaf350 TaxID=2876565 RepID=UPI001E53E214|nr:SDR family oxidoreductase [Aeromicrobium sp. Leaf350]